MAHRMHLRVEYTVRKYGKAEGKGRLGSVGESNRIIELNNNYMILK